MVATNYLSILAAITSIVASQDAFYMCTDNACEKCPASVISTGGPTEDGCVTYSSADTFANQGFNGTEGGGYEVFFDVQAADPGCQTIVRSPAGTDLPGCGVAMAIFKQPVCAKLALEKTFMLQSCCGDACDQLGGKKIRGIGPMGVASLYGRGLGAYMIKDANGNIIKPAEIGSPPEMANAQQGKRQLDVKPAELVQRSGRCKDGSWKGGDTLTKPANNVQIVSDSVVGPADIQVSKKRSQTWSTSMSAGFSFKEIFDLGVSTEMSETVESSKTITVQIAEGQTGKLGFTATMSCKTGSGECDGEEVSGEVCWPTKNSEGDVAGTYRVIIET